jgi:hypothetical protein
LTDGQKTTKRIANKSAMKTTAKVVKKGKGTTKTPKNKLKGAAKSRKKAKKTSLFGNIISLLHHSFKSAI